MIKIEFFHDVICSFCFPMSYRMRKITEKYNDIKIIHRSFALGYKDDDFIRSFGSREAVKDEVISHWDKANQNDDEHRFNIEGMRNKKFDFPLSRKPLLAAKAAEVIGGQDAYWDLFDELQKRLFMENENIEEDYVIEEAVRNISINFEDWKKAYEDSDTEDLVVKDIELAKSYNIYSVPSLVINEKYLLSGAQEQSIIENAIMQIAKKEGEILEVKEDDNMCRVVDGEIKC